jgi:hypothetical protein
VRPGAAQRPASGQRGVPVAGVLPAAWSTSLRDDLGAWIGGGPCDRRALALPAVSSRFPGHDWSFGAGGRPWNGPAARSRSGSSRYQDRHAALALDQPQPRASGSPLAFSRFPFFEELFCERAASSCCALFRIAVRSGSK